MKHQKYFPFIIVLPIIIGLTSLLFLLSRPTRQLTNNSNDQTCQTDGDCVMAPIQCSCHCGTPINKIHLQKYLDQQEQNCRTYSGPMCDMSCPKIPKCQDNQCQVEE